MPLRCLIIDDDPNFRQEMRGLLTEQGLDIVATAGSKADALRQITQLTPDIALIDIDLGSDSGFELARELHQQPTPPQTILISTHDETEYTDLIQASPAIGFLPKIDISATTIQQLLNTTHNPNPPKPNAI